MIISSQGCQEMNKQLPIPVNEHSLCFQRPLISYTSKNPEFWSCRRYMLDLPSQNEGLRSAQYWLSDSRSTAYSVTLKVLSHK